jgi:hypothetical protein
VVPVRYKLKIHIFYIKFFSDIINNVHMYISVYDVYDKKKLTIIIGTNIDFGISTNLTNITINVLYVPLLILIN